MSSCPDTTAVNQIGKIGKDRKERKNRARHIHKTGVAVRQDRLALGTRRTGDGGGIRGRQAYRFDGGNARARCREGPGCWRTSSWGRGRISHGGSVGALGFTVGLQFSREVRETKTHSIGLRGLFGNFRAKVTERSCLLTSCRQTLPR